MIDLSGLNALVCGSSNGIGRASAEVLARAGARIVLIARNHDALQDVALGLDGAGHETLVADFDRPEIVRDVVSAYVGDHDPIEILVNNSGGPKGGPIVEAQTEEFLAAINRHVVCNQILVQTLLPGMRKAGYGRIINVISTSVREPIAGLGVSNTTRGAVASWAKTLSGELAPEGITVNNVLPGYTATGRLQSLMEARASKSGKTAQDIAAEWRGLVPMGRFAGPEEIANAIAFLASPLAAYITGVSLPVDGGRISSI